MAINSLAIKRLVAVKEAMDSVPESERTALFKQFYTELSEDIIVAKYNSYVFRDGGQRQPAPKDPLLAVHFSLAAGLEC